MQKFQKAKEIYPEWFGPKNIGPICFHEDVVIDQRKLMFSKTKQKIPNSVGFTQIYVD